MKRCLSLFLSLVMAFTALFAVNTTAYASGWVSSAKSVKYGTWYNEYLDVETDSYYYHGCKITVPARGTVSIRIQQETSTPEFKIYKANNIDSVYASSSGEGDCRTFVDFGYSSGGGYEWDVQNFLLPAGSYYIAFFSSWQKEFDFKISYTQSFSKTSLSKVTAKKKAFNAKWKKCSNVSGYQLQYSTKKNMKSAITFTFKGNKTTSKTVSKLKSKKKYYVRVRTYKTVKVNGKNKTYYSKWSSVKTVKTK